MRKVHKTRRLWVFKAVFVFLLFWLTVALLPMGRVNPVRASAEENTVSTDWIAIEKYDIHMDIGVDRQVRVQEKIQVRFLRKNLTMFCRSLPVESARYYDISAKCEGNPDFYFEVKDNPDTNAFFDINCIGGAEAGNVWTYEIAFTMENGSGSIHTSKGMHIDVVPFGFTVPLQNVTAEMHFPYAVAREDLQAYVGYGNTTPVAMGELSADGKTYTFSVDTLEVEYNSIFEERVAKGVSVAFQMDGKFADYHAKRFFTDGMWIIALGGVVAGALAFLARMLLSRRTEIATVVNFTAPDNLDPMKMGKLLDGQTDEDDVTSMIYYFANKGYLTIDLSNEDNPVFTKIQELPNSALPHENTLFNGLFASGNTVSVEDLQLQYYKYVDTAKMQVPAPKMYTKPSIWAYVSGGIISVLYAMLITMLLGVLRLGTTYSYILGIMWFIPAGLVLIVGYMLEGYRYKWKKQVRNIFRIAQAVVMGLGIVICTLLFSRHFLTGYERIVIYLFASVIPFITQNAICRTPEYCETLGGILGFKEFIIATEEDKIKFMLQENPKLYYKILPYAQVLGVTDEWEEKFKNILIAPPDWCTNARGVTYFDYMVMRSAMHSAMANAISRPTEGGQGVGRSGGGGSFGGFGGGGFGGGGGGAR